MSKPTPTPRGWRGGSKDFTVTKQQDGHINGMVGSKMYAEDCDDEGQERGD